MADGLDKVLDHFPLLDGSGRRRFIAGGIIVIGFAFLNMSLVEKIFGRFDASDIFASPMIAAGLVLIVYAIGSIADLFGELFLVRAAAGLFIAFRFPGNYPGSNPLWQDHVVAWLVAILLFVPRALIGIFLGLIGRTRYGVDIESRLSQQALQLFKTLPEKVAIGIRQPVGDSAEVAFKHLIDKFDSESDKKWARRQITRAKDVSATTTALLIVFVLALLADRLKIDSEEPKIAEALTVQKTVGQFRESTRGLVDTSSESALVATALRVLEQQEPAQQSAPRRVLEPNAASSKASQLEVLAPLVAPVLPQLIGRLTDLSFPILPISTSVGVINSAVERRMLVDPAVIKSMDDLLERYSPKSPQVTPDGLKELERFVFQLRDMSERKKPFGPDVHLVKQLSEIKEIQPGVYGQWRMDEVADRVKRGLRLDESMMVRAAEGITTHVKDVKLSTEITSKYLQLRTDLIAYHDSRSRKLAGVDELIKFVGATRENARSVYEATEMRAVEGWLLNDNDLPAAYLPTLTDQIRNWRSEAVYPIAQELRSQVEKYNLALTDRLKGDALRTVAILLLVIPFLFLYLGFFVSVRNAHMTILEALAT